MGNPFPQILAYEGGSMEPVLKTSDILHLSQCRDTHFRCGDVVAFRPPGCSDIVVHRITSRSHRGIRTRGDSNSHTDSWNLTTDRIIGRVVQRTRGNRVRSVRGGLSGHLCALRARYVSSAVTGVSCLLRPLYHALLQSLPLGRWLSVRQGMRVCSFSRGDGIEFHLIFAGRVIGRLLPHRDRWTIRQSFRIFVDEHALPRGTSPGTS